MVTPDIPDGLPHEQKPNLMYDQTHTRAEINVTSNLQSIETIRVRGLSKQTQYLDTYVRVLRKKFC